MNFEPEKIKEGEIIRKETIYSLLVAFAYEHKQGDIWAFRETIKSLGNLTETQVIQFEEILDLMI